MELILENVRCFAERQTIPVKPLTLLVGENSAGKSTFLAMLSAVSDRTSFPLRSRFNTSPYNLGNYDTIATNYGGKAGQATSFSLGITKNIKPKNDILRFVSTYHDNNGSVEVAEIEASSKNVRNVFVYNGMQEWRFSVTDFQRAETQVFDLDLNKYSGSTTSFGIMDLVYLSHLSLRATSHITSKELPASLQSVQDGLSEILQQIRPRPTISIAPIRTKPKRTYDEVIEEFSPEGEHIPFVLDDVLQDVGNRAILEIFGKESGLFSKVTVKQWGRKRSDPIQIMVTNEGRPASSAANLVDVGYGVSQALPLVVQSLLAAPESRLLLQQPEVHLHPRAQAALGTLFVDLLATTKKQFVVETHSDYILDRVRQEVAKGHVAASDVGILYFERGKNGTHVYPIELDDKGNITNAPPSYRSFFLQEEYNLLTRAHKNGARK